MNAPTASTRAADAEIWALARAQYEPVVRAALDEDLGLAGDITSNVVVSAHTQAHCAFRARKHGVVAGLDVARLVFELLSAEVELTLQCRDGERIEPGQTLAIVRGPARAVLTGERVALNLLGRLSGIASATRQLVDQTDGTKAKICCTRKTTPGLRALEKYAVRAGGGVNHRFLLGDGILIKDNHIALAGGLRNAVSRALELGSHMVKIEVEVDTLEQLDTLLEYPVDAVLLDNMDPPTLREAVARVRASGRRMVTEASGGIDLEKVRAVAQSGVDLISSGWITHSAPTLDIGLDFLD